MLNLCLLALFIVIPLAAFNSADQSGLSPHKANLAQSIEKDFADIIDVKVTYYNPVASQCDKTPLITASGAKIDIKKTTDLHWCAISRNLHKRYGGPFSFGDVIEIKSPHNKKIGKYVVQDLMNPRFKNRIDILRGTGEGGMTYNKAKVKHPKLKNYNRNLAKKKDKLKLNRQVARGTIQKFIARSRYFSSGADLIRQEKYKPLT